MIDGAGAEAIDCLGADDVELCGHLPSSTNGADGCRRHARYEVIRNRSINVGRHYRTQVEIEGDLHAMGDVGRGRRI
jgi:hypothetical protein